MKAKNIYVLIVVVLLVVLAIFIAKKLVKTESNDYQTNSDSSDSSGSSNIDYSTDDNASFPLLYTSPMKRGWNVKQLQKWLNKKAMKTGILATIKEDGIFGTKTETLLSNITGKNTMTEAEFNSYGIYGMF